MYVWGPKGERQVEANEDEKKEEGCLVAKDLTCCGEWEVKTLISFRVLSRKKDDDVRIGASLAWIGKTANDQTRRRLGVNVWEVST